MGVRRDASSSARPLRDDNSGRTEYVARAGIGKPVHVATEDTDLAAELKRGLSFIRSEKGVKA